MSVSIGGGSASEGSRAAEPYLHGMLASMDMFGIIVLMQKGTVLKWIVHRE